MPWRGARRRRLCWYADKDDDQNEQEAENVELYVLMSDAFDDIADVAPQSVVVVQDEDPLRVTITALVSLESM